MTNTLDPISSGLYESHTAFAAMANLAQLFVREMTAPGAAWILLLVVPLFFLLVHYSVVPLLSRKRRKQQAGLHPPPSPPALPILGHLHLVGALPHVSLRALAKKLGHDLMLVRLGAMPVLVVSSPRAAEAVLRTHDIVFASRPHSLTTEIILYGPSDVGFAPYGEHWRQARKFVITHLLSANKVRSFRLEREEEVSKVVARIGEAAAAGAAVDMTRLLDSFTNDLACRIVMGKFFRNQSGLISKQLQELLGDTSLLIGGFHVEEFFPFLARFRVFGKAVRAKSKRVRRKWDELLDGLIQDHEKGEEEEGSSPATTASDPGAFIHVMLSLRQEYGFTREQMKAILLDVILGGIETASSTLEFTVAELMRKPDAMRKLQAEVRSRAPSGPDEPVREANLADMPYLRAVIKESLRLHPVAPLLAPHLSMSSCDVDGFAVPEGTCVLINAWAIGRDARSWEDPEEFVPERFVDSGAAADVSFRGKHFQLLPFGAGRRMCPGMYFAMASIELMLANLVNRFDWELPPGLELRDVDMSEVSGLVVRRKQKLLLVPKLRA